MARRKTRRFREDDYSTWSDGECAAEILHRCMSNGVAYEKFFKWFKSLPDESAERLAGILTAWDQGFPPRGL